MVYGISLVIFVIICLSLVGIILLQASKTGGMGTAMGQQAMGAAFGGESGDKLLVKITGGLAGGYMLLAIIINLILSPGTAVPGNESIIGKRAQTAESILNPIEFAPAATEIDTAK